MNLNYQDEGHLYANCLLYVLTIYPKYLLLQFLTCGIRMHIPILTGVQNGDISWKKSHILLKTFRFENWFLRWSTIYVNFLFYILTIFRIFDYFQFLGCGISMYYIPILTEIENGWISSWKNGHSLLKMYFLKLNFKVQSHLDANSFFYIFAF